MPVDFEALEGLVLESIEVLAGSGVRLPRVTILAGGRCFALSHEDVEDISGRAETEPEDLSHMFGATITTASAELSLPHGGVAHDCFSIGTARGAWHLELTAVAKEGRDIRIGFRETI